MYLLKTAKTILAYKIRNETYLGKYKVTKSFPSPHLFCALCAPDIVITSIPI